MFFFLKKNQIVNVLRSLTVSIAFFCNFATIRDFEKVQVFFAKRIYSLSKNFQKTQILKFLRFSNISVAFHSRTATFSGFSKTLFFQRTIFFQTMNQILNTLRNLTISFAIYIIFANIIFKKIQDFWSFWEIEQIQSHSAATLPFMDFRKIKDVPSINPTNVSWINLVSKRCEKSNTFSCLLQKICYL